MRESDPAESRGWVVAAAAMTGVRREELGLDEPRVDALAPGTGVASTSVRRYRGRGWRLVRKELHAPADPDHPSHWAYWRREELAYASGLLPDGRHGLVTPRCWYAEPLGERAVALWLDDVTDEGPDWDVPAYAAAARRLGAWQAATLASADRARPPWLAADQLVARIARADAGTGLVQPDWSRPGLRAFDRRTPARIGAIWARRHTLLRGRAAAPEVLSHGDFHRGNLVARKATTVVLDWATLGTMPLGADPAYLTLGAVEALAPSRPDEVEDAIWSAYAGELPRAERARARAAYAATIALVGVARLCWRPLYRPAEGAEHERWLAAWCRKEALGWLTAHANPLAGGVGA